MSQFLQDIVDQPDVLRHCHKQYLTFYQDRLSQLTQWRKGRTTLPVVFVGMGSSLYAPQAITPLLNSHGVATYIQEAGELLHYGLGGVPQDALIVAVSQSGESAETKQVVDRLCDKHQIVSITNNLESSIARNAHLVLPMFAGEESAASTKTFVASILVLYLASKAMLNQSIAADLNFDNLMGECAALTTKLIKNIADHLEFLGGIDNLNIIGRGPALACVYHGALIMKETADSHAEGMAGGTFRHGPLELAGPDHKAVVLAPTGPTSALNINLAKELAGYGSRVILLTDKDISASKNLAVIAMPRLTEDLVSIPYILPLELLAWDAAKRLGRHSGIPRLITKVTMRE